MEKRQILVTGGLGYIGSHTVVVLQEKGFEVCIVDDLSNSKRVVLDGITKITGNTPEFLELDLKDTNALQRAMQNRHFDGVIHFAAHKAVGESVENPIKYYRNNLLALLNVLEEVPSQNFIFSSSCTIYGQADEQPIRESAPEKKAESPYGATKQMGETILRDVAKLGRWNTIALRYFNPIGAHESSEIGELPLGVPANLIPFVTQTAAGIRKELRIFGDDYPTKDGTAVRDYIYVVDLAQAHLLAVERLIAQKNDSSYEAYNLGTGTGSTVKEVVDAFEQVTGVAVPHSFAERREGDITAAYADYTLANEKLGWEPKTDLRAALKTAWRWQQKIGE